MLFGGFRAFHNEFTYSGAFGRRHLLLGFSDIDCYVARAWIISIFTPSSDQIEKKTLSRASCHFPLAVKESSHVGVAVYPFTSHLQNLYTTSVIYANRNILDTGLDLCGMYLK
jgi:hypothetical protein